MLLASIHAGLHPAGGSGENPSEPAATHGGFKSAVPKKRTGRIEIFRSVGETHRISPDATGIAELVLLDK